jgi:UDP-GlcNAc:undecaprenyl-phosphate/decaprenyl-phosphate GlcNAc-1-phosphate transferase
MLESSQYYYLILSSFFVGMILFTIITNSILLNFVKTLGIREKDSTVIRWSAASKPAIGGITFFIVFLISFIFFSIFFVGSVFLDVVTFGLVISMFMAFLMGLADDAYNTKPNLKFFVQVACGLVLFFSGTSVDFFDNQYLNLALTIIWVVGIMNSINMLDNMDGITSVVSIFILSTSLVVMVLNNLLFSLEFVVILGIVAALVGFLFHNWNPSKMYMGDTGSQFLGLILAFVGIKYFWNIHHFVSLDIPRVQSIVVVMMVFVLPIVDTTTVVINRLRRKQSPFVGGKDHTTHCLSYSGLSDSQVAMLFMGVALISAILTLYVTHFIQEWSWATAMVGVGYFLVILFYFYYLSRLYKSKYC